MLDCRSFNDILESSAIMEIYEETISFKMVFDDFNSIR